ncbi:ABC transporter substrate-binding protein [Haloarcula litorea]|uniref:ABC transporter substrate-binding protein n=1 Tax=Haloarcula litorea TaxID=3032579 RepID=UPI0023E8482A|nr:ABC transporter substrate-binding protein [Halomicroarcula sp. GDY20]
MAGCSGIGGGGGGGGGGIDPVQDRVTVDPADIQEGGTFRAALGSGVDTFDPPESSSANSSVHHNLLYETMITTDASGTIYPWLAESYEQTEVQDIQRTAYTDYMKEVSYAETDDGTVFIDTDQQIVVEHPDNPSDPSAGDTAQVMTVEEAPDAIADGTFGMEYEFQLHEGINFVNGEELTADNVVASYQRLRGSALSGQVFDSLLDVQSDGDYTVRLYAQIPDAAFVREIAGFSIYPTEITGAPDEPQNVPLGGMDPREEHEPLGTGPFRLTDYENENYATYTKVDDYWFDTEMKDWFDGSSEFPNGPVVDKVDIAVISSPSSRAAALQEGEVDMARGLSSSTLTNFQESEEFRTAPTAGAGYLFMQFPVTQGPWQNAKLRRAVNKLIPRPSISNNIFQGWENPAWVPLPPLAAATGTTDYEELTEDLKPYNTYEQEEAATMLDEVGEEAGIEYPIEVTIETNSDNKDRVRVVELIAQSMNQEIDGTQYFDVSVNTKEFLTFVSQLLTENYYNKGKIAVIGLSGGFGPHGYAKSIHSPENFAQCCNFQNIDIERLNEAMRNARYGVDVAEDKELRRERYNDVWEIVLEENANSYITHSTTVGVVGTEVKGFNSYPSVQDIVGYALHNPADEQITYLDR